MAGELGAVLIIDDSEPLLARMKQALVGAGYTVITTTQPIGAARHLRQCDLVVIDFHMPGVDGSHVVASMRTAAAASDCRCAFYLYTSDAAAAANYAAYGFDGSFVQKGNEAALVSQVAAAIRMQRLKRLKR